jgi:hypothetical protein
VRFHHQVELKTLFNGILRAKAGTITKFYQDNHAKVEKLSKNVGDFNARFCDSYH